MKETCTLCGCERYSEILALEMVIEESDRAVSDNSSVSDGNVESSNFGSTLIYVGAGIIGVAAVAGGGMAIAGASKRKKKRRRKNKKRKKNSGKKRSSNNRLR